MVILHGSQTVMLNLPLSTVQGNIAVPNGRFHAHCANLATKLDMEFAKAERKAAQKNTLQKFVGHTGSVSERNCIIVEAGGGKGFWERNFLDPVQQLMGECVSC
jgi:hypothetical protein